MQVVSTIYIPAPLKNTKYVIHVTFIVLLSYTAALERECLVNSIELNYWESFTMLEEQMIEYFLMVDGNVTLNKLMNIYYYFNPRLDFKNVYHDRIEPLVNKGIFDIMDGTGKNKRLCLNKKYVQINVKDFKYLNLKDK